MAKRQPAASTQLKIANEKIAELEKQLKAKSESNDSWYKKSNELEAEIEQVHALLDALPGTAGRKTESEDSWHRKEIKTMTRLAAYLANRA